MVDWYVNLPWASRKQRLWALLLLVVCWLDLARGWDDLHDGLAIARWIAWMMIAGAVLLAPACLLVLVSGRAPRWFAFSHPGRLARTIPQIREEIRQEHAGRERNSRRF